jgi:hypothetical protein
MRFRDFQRDITAEAAKQYGPMPAMAASKNLIGKDIIQT